MQRKWPVVLALGVLGCTAWGAFYAYAQNQEKLSSSVFKQILTIIRDNAELQGMLGEAIRPEPTWYLNGDPWISGAVRIASEPIHCCEN